MAAPHPVVAPIVMDEPDPTPAPSRAIWWAVGIGGVLMVAAYRAMKRDRDDGKKLEALELDAIRGEALADAYGELQRQYPYATEAEIREMARAPGGAAEQIDRALRGATWKG